MEVFKDYAGYYELLYKDKDYNGEAAYLANLIDKFSEKNIKSILDLGCGTGTHASLLAKKYQRVEGIDISENMILQAREKKLGNMDFHHQDVVNFSLPNRFDVITSLFHVVSYQTTNDSIMGMIKQVSFHLNGGGLFIFDVWYGPAVLTLKPETRVKRLENDKLKIARLAESELLPNENCVNVHYEIIIQNKLDLSVSFVQETHKMRYYFLPELEMLLNNNNMQLLHSEEWMSGNIPDDKTWGVCFVARKNTGTK